MDVNYIYIYIYIHTHTHTHTHNGILLNHKKQNVAICCHMDGMDGPGGHYAK